LIASSAVRSNDCWVFLNVQEIITNLSQDPSTNQTTTFTNSLTVCEFSETPAQIKSEIKISGLASHANKDVQLSIREILDYVRLHPGLSQRDKAVLDTKLHEKLAEPWTCVVVVLIALPFGAVSARRNVFAGVASSVFICFAFFVLARFGSALGTGGYITPWLAAWLPNILFAAGALLLLRRFR
jgi:lipopolysaccharide export system permease protein